jgi:AmmeMemoRadiSam system protein A
MAEIQKMNDQETAKRSRGLVFLPLAKIKGWKAQWLDWHKRADLVKTSNSPNEAARPPCCSPALTEFDASERKLMLQWAHQAVARAVDSGELPDISQVSGKLSQKRACFVTLTKTGTLRGCIGNLQAQAPLYQAVLENARGAALRDPRFSPVLPEEVVDLRIEISVLTQPQPLEFASADELLEKISPFEHGVLLHIKGQMATFLPKVWEQIPEKTRFLDQLAQKAGYPPGAWRDKAVAISLYHVETFEDPPDALVNN